MTRNKPNEEKTSQAIRRDFQKRFRKQTFVTLKL